MSPPNMMCESFLENLIQCYNKNMLSCCHLEFVISVDHSLINSRVFFDNLQRIRALGVILTLSYPIISESSLLTQCMKNFDRMTVDFQSIVFVRSLENQIDRLEWMTSLMQSCEISVIISGISNWETYDMLLRTNADLLQPTFDWIERKRFR